MRVATIAIMLGAVVRANEAGDRMPAAATTSITLATEAEGSSIAQDLLKLGAVAGLNTCNAW